MTTPSIDPKVLGEYDRNVLEELIRWGEFLPTQKVKNYTLPEAALVAALPTLLTLHAAVSAPKAKGRICEQHLGFSRLPKEECIDYEEGKCRWDGKKCTAQPVLIIPALTTDGKG